MYTHFADKCPSIYPFDLEFAFLRRLIGVGSTQSADLEEKGGAQTYRDTRAAAQAGPDGNRRAECIYAGRSLAGSEREEEVEERSRRVDMPLSRRLGELG